MRLAIWSLAADRASARAVFAALVRLTGERAIEVRSDESRLPLCDAVIVAGASSLAETADCAAMAGLRVYAAVGGPVLGLGAGFTLLCQAGLLPGAVVVRRTRAGTRRAPTTVHVRIEGRPTPFTAAIPAGRVLRLDRERAPLTYAAPDLDQLESQGQVIFRYTDAAGGVLPGDDEIAGISNSRGNVVGLFPHAATTRDDGKQIFVALRRHLRAV